MSLSGKEGAESGLTGEQRQLVDHAVRARRNAVAHHSRYPVGAALEDGLGEIFIGANVESSSYGLSMCAERVALFKALSEGVRSFRRIAIVAGGPAVATPCGACRQVLLDHAGDVEVILLNPDTEGSKVFRLRELLPEAFSDAQLRSRSRE